MSFSSIHKMAAKVVLAALAISQLAIFAPTAAKAAPDGTGLVISQVQISGSSAADEFVEIYNPTSVSADITGLKLHIRNSTGSSDTNKTVTFVSGHATTILAHGYFLFVSATASAALLSLADATYANAMVADGSVYISTSSDKLTAVIDMLGWNAQVAGGFETTSFGTRNPVAGESMVRKPNDAGGNGTDSNVNADDFMFLSPSTPRNTLSLTRPLGVSALTLSAGDGQISAGWTAVPTATHFDFGLTATGSPFGADTRVEVDTLAHVFSGLVNGTSYTVRVRAVRAGGIEEVSEYTSQSATPTAPIVVAPDHLTALATYARNGQTGIAFGAGAVHASLSQIQGLLNGETPTKMTFTRPNADPISLALTCSSLTECATASDFSATPSDGSQDGRVAVAVTTSQGRSVRLDLGTDSFTLDTNVRPPSATVTSRCFGHEDSFTAQAENDVTTVSIYRRASLTPQDLVAMAPATVGAVDEVFIGDNVFTTLYLVAKDSLGNTSGTATLTNDLAPPAEPNLHLTSSNKSIQANWDSVNGAANYRLRWRLAGGAWQEKIVSATDETIAAVNGRTYEVSLSSRDAACNESASVIQKTTPHLAFASVAAVTPADHETPILTKAIQVDAPKDGLPAPSSPAEPKSSVVSSPNESPAGPGPTTVKDRSNLIVTIAIILIIAGVAIAAYSWYQGDTGEAPKRPTVKPASGPRRRGRPRKGR